MRRRYCDSVRMAELVEIDASDLRREKNMYRIADRNGKIKEQNSAQDRLLEWLYGHCVGRLLLRPLVTPAVSKLEERFCLPDLPVF